MKVRLSGSTELVRAWGEAFRRTFGVTGQEYPARKGTGMFIYINIDDRVAAAAIRDPDDLLARSEASDGE